MKRCLIDNEPIKLFHANKMSDNRFICKYHFQELGISYTFFKSDEFQHATKKEMIFMINNNK